jgi:CubicO group peptidase (beta-lactamase class C family)
MKDLKAGMASVLALAGGLALTVFVQAQGLPRTAPASMRLDEAKLNAATQLITQFVTERKVAGAVAAVARRGRLAYFEAVGVQDLETRTPMSERSVFPIYSMTRQVTAVAAMMLHEEGKFRLDDPIANYLPEFAAIQVLTPDGKRAPARPITVEDVFLHTSGINDRQTDLYRGEQVHPELNPFRN